MHEDNFEDDLGPSKSQVKRDMHELQALGEELTRADKKMLKKCQLPERLLAAIEEYKRLPNARAGKKRQLQFIGRIMREIDTSHITAILDQQKQGTALENRRFQQLEQVREQLIAGDTAVLDKLISDHPELDIQHIRQLIRQSQKEQQENKPPAASRKLFRYLRELTE